MAASTAGGLPNASQSGAVDHVGYKDGLYRELEQLTEVITALGGDGADGGAVFEIESQVEL